MRNKYIAAGQDCLGEHHGLGNSLMDFKVTSADSDGGLFIIENSFREKGGPARNLHHDQDEWFYVLEGEFRFEIGEERITLIRGDSVLGPRQVPHVGVHRHGSHPNGVHASRENGILLSGDHQGGCDAAAGPCALACPWDETTGSAIGCIDASDFDLVIQFRELCG